MSHNTEREKAIREECARPTPRQPKPEEKTGHSFTTETEIAEQVVKWEKNTPTAAFFVYNTEWKDPIVLQEYNGYKPLINEAVKKNAVLFPEDIAEYGNTAQLLVDIEAHIEKYLDVDPTFREFATYYIILTWFQDKINTIPYLRALGDTGTGKSRFLDTIGHLCYRAIKAAGTITPAPLFRLIEVWKGTVLLDEADRKQSDTTDETIKILNCGFERGRPVIRCDKDNPKDIETHETYCAKIIASRYPFEDKALEARCITTTIEETPRKNIPPVLLSEYHQEKKQLQNKLLLFRLKNWHKLTEENIEKAFAELTDLEPRLRQTAAPFFIIFGDDAEVKQRFLKFMLDYNRELRQERADSLEGQVVHAYCELVKTMDIITAQDITGQINLGLPEGKGYSAKRIGRVVKSLKMSSKMQRIEGRVRRILSLTPQQLLVLRKRYGAEEEEPAQKTLECNVSNDCNISKFEAHNTPNEH